MRSIKALELLNTGRIEELKSALQDEVYEEALKTNRSAKRRYTAMKKYFTYYNPARECLQKPCPIEFEGEKYTSFTNSWSLALTTEPTGELELFDTANGNYPDVGRIINFDGEPKKVDFREVLARAKKRGYKLKKSEFGSNNFLMKYDGAYFRIALLDATFAIIDNGEEALVYHPENKVLPMTIKTSLGIAVIMPIRYDGNPEAEGNVVIEVPEEEVRSVEPKEIEELINRRRRQVLVHSVIYYKMDDNIITDAQWSKWAMELTDLQRRFPDIAANCWYADEFEGFDGSSGFDLPLDDPWAVHKARYLIQLRDSKAEAA